MTEVTDLASVDPADLGLGASGAAGRIGRGLAANIGGMGVTLVIQLVSVPVFLAVWGVPTYGEWLVLSAVPTYVALSDLSFSSVAGNSMVMLEAGGRHADAVVLGRRLWSIVTSLTGAVVLAAIAIVMSIGGAFGAGAAIPTSEAQAVLVGLLLQVAVGNQYGVLDAWYRAGGRYPLGTTMRQLGRLLEFGALMGAVVLGASPSTAAIAFLAGGVAGFGASWLVLRRAVPWSTFRPERPQLRTFRELLAPGMAFLAFPIGNALSLQGLTIVVGATLGPGPVVVFSVARTITRVPFQLLGSINNSIWPELSRSIGSGRLDEARAILRHSVQLALVVSLALAFALAVFGVAIIRWWTRDLVDPPLLLLLILLLVVIANSTWTTFGSALVATNRHKRLAVVYLAGTIAAVLGAIPLGSALGLPGTATALLTIDVAMVTYALPAALRVVEDRPTDFLRVVLDVTGALRSALSSARSAT